ncbi:MAG TPA: ABC transporter substrate-binding protein [Aliidongia sp.]|nr:ABC transporter substrate-binding protein [Aliidongia sp.]
MPDPGRPSRRTLLRAAAAAPWLLAGPARAQGDGIAVRIEQDIQTLDPAERASAIEGNVIRAVCRNLVAFKRGSFEIENDAAAEIRQVSDTAIEFTLKDGLEFTGGYGPLTADDVKFSYERFLSVGPDGRKPAYAADWAALDRIEVTGPLTGRILLKHPSAALWANAMADVSGAILSRDAWTRLGREASLKLVGAGPYRIEEWTPNRRLVLRRNEAYLGDPSDFERITLRPIAGSTTSVLAFRAHELQLTRIEANDKHRLEHLPGTRLIDLPSINFVWLGLNMAKPPFDDARVRRAIRLALDPGEIVTAAYDGTVAPARALLAPGMLGYWEAAPVRKRDVEAARKLLGGGFRATLTLLNKFNYITAAEVIQAQLAEIGVAVDLRPLDGGSFWSSGDGEVGKRLELFLLRFGGKADSSFISQWFLPAQIGSWNWQRWNDPEYARLYDQAAAAGDPAERAALYIRMQQLMDRSDAIIPLTHETSLFLDDAGLDPALLPNGDDQQYALFRRL